MVVLIDGNNLLYCQTAAANLSSKGRPTSGIFGMLKEIQAVMQKYEPSKCMVVWDGKRSRKRMELFPEYKSGRKKKTPEQEELFQKFLYQKPIVVQASLNLGLYSVEGKLAEADDVIAILADVTVNFGEEVVIVSTDKDFYQLISPSLRIFKPTQAEPREITERVLLEKWNIRPDQWLDLRAVTGDTSDSIVGVKGVGEKTIGDLLKAWGSLDKFYNGNTPNGKRQADLMSPEGKTVVERNKKLMSLKEPCCYPDDLEAVEIVRGSINMKAVRDMLVDYEIKSIYLMMSPWMEVFYRHDQANGGVANETIAKVA